jgi:hypothetical protein
MADERRFVLYRAEPSYVQGVINGLIDHLRERYRALGENQQVEVVVRPRKRDRSLAQNNLAHKWFQEIANHVEAHWGQRYPAEAWKEWLKIQYLGQEVHTMPDGKVIAYTRHTRDLSVEEFTHFLEQVDAWVAQELGCQLTHPEDLYAEAMGRGRDAA